MPLQLLLLLRPHYTLHLKPKESRRLVEWVGASSPPGEEHAQADGLEDASEGTNSDRVHGALLREHLRDELPSQKVSRKPHIQFNNHVRSQQQENKNKHLQTYRRSGAGHEDQTAQVGGTLVAQRASGVDKRTDTVRLDGGADDGRTPRGGGTGGLLGPDELLLGVGRLGARVGVAEDGGQDGERGGVCEDGA